MFDDRGETRNEGGHFRFPEIRREVLVEGIGIQARESVPQSPLAEFDVRERVVHVVCRSETASAVDKPCTPVRVDQEVPQVAVAVGHQVVEDLHHQPLLIPALCIRRFDVQLA